MVIITCCGMSRYKLAQQNINHELINPVGKDIEERILTPDGYERVKTTQGSFGTYLRNLSLKPNGTPVTYYNGNIKSNKAHIAVVDLKIGSKDLHQCADAVMRLKAEYLWKSEQYDKIHFNFTNGHKVEYKEWMKGRRMIVQGNKTKWNNNHNPSNTYQDFWEYMELIFMYAGTASLEKELASVEMHNMKIGDVLIQGGFPGHAVIVVDMAINPHTGEKLYLLAQSYMPAQETHVLVNNNDVSISPWYGLDDNEIIITPEWTFNKTDLKRFKN